MIDEAEVAVKVSSEEREKNHLHVMGLFGVILSKSSPRLVYSLMEKGDLHRLLRENKGKYTQKQLLCFMHQTLLGLEFIHNIPVVHGDLATRNLLIDGNDCLKISDFGKSKKCYNAYAKDRLEREDQPWRWLPVELYSGGHLTIRCDIWAFGVTCWEMFTAGKLPYAESVSFEKYVANNFRLAKPIDCDTAIYLISK